MTPAIATYPDVSARYPQFSIAVVVCALVYLPGLFGGFLFDDFGVIVDNPALRGLGGSSFHWLQLALSSNAGMLRRPISMLSFGLDYRLFGLSPFAFKLTNLAIHLCSGALLYALARRLIPRLIGATDSHNAPPARAVALLVSALWLLHPLNVSTVVYVVQRMNMLATLFVLAGLVCYAEGRARMLRDERGALAPLAGICLFGVLATLSKENGALIPAYALVVEALCFRFEVSQPEQSRILKAFFWLSVALPLMLFAVYLATHPHWLANGYAGRNFTIEGRVLSEARILCDYLLWIFVPNPAWMGIYHDDIATSTGLFNPISTGFAIVFLLTLIIAAWKLRRRSPGFTFGVAWFLVGHAMESTILPLELVFEHRNYLPMAGLLLGALSALAALVPSRWSMRSLTIGCVALALGLAGLTAVRAMSWGNPLRLALDDAHHHPDSSRDQYAAAREIVIDGATRDEREIAEQKAMPYFARSAMLDKTDVFSASSLLVIQASSGPVDPAAVADLADRLRNATSYVQANSFLYLLSRATEKPLSLTPGDFSLLVEAALANSHFPPYTRAMILNNYGAYQLLAVHDNQRAISLMMAAAAEDPSNAYFEIRLTQMALALKQQDVARQHLHAAVRLNNLGTYNKDIEKLQKQLAAPSPPN